MAIDQSSTTTGDTGTGDTGTGDTGSAGQLDTELARRAEIARRGALARNLFTVSMVWRREMIRFGRSKARIITGLAQPILFLFVLGFGLGRVIGSRGIAGVSYQEFLFPGVLVMSILFTAMFSAISIVWDREFGFLREMLVAPVSRGALVLGKAAGGGTIAVAQGALLLLAAPVVGVSLSFFDVLAMLGLLLMLAFCIVAFGIVVASGMKTIESFQVVMSLVVNPMLFLSGALFPLQGLPGWLNTATRFNPVSYGVDPVRRVLLGDEAAMTLGGEVVPIWLEVSIVLAVGAVMLGIAVKLFSREG